LHRGGHELALVLTQPDRPVGRGLKHAASAVKAYAASQGLPVYQPVTLKGVEAHERLRAAQVDALIVAAYGLILPQAILEVAPQGALNIHASLLPRWRGAAPIQRALLAGDRETGISIMRMEAGLDTGPVHAQRAISIAPDEDAGTLHDRLAELGARMMLEVLAGPIAAPRPQPAEGVTYAAKITKEDALIDWQRPAAEIERQVRAFRPMPGASTRLDGESLKIWRARAVQGDAAPGALVRAGEDALVIGCGSGLLEVSEVQRPGARRMAAAEFLRGRPLRPGTRFA
jgi:methionyl-tRNA formyltransferase